MLLLIGGMLCAYFLGSIPTGYLLGKFLKGIDIREHGSGNPGATNVFRVVGKTAGILTLLIDCLKGFLPVWFFLTTTWNNHFLAEARSWFFLETTPSPKLVPNLWPVSLIGLSAIVGHNFSIFLSFKGGKGVATSTGVFLALLPLPTLAAIGFFLIGLITTRHVSIGSILGAVSLCISTWLLTASVFLTGLTLFCALLILFLHRKNIYRLIQRQEPKIYLRDKRDAG